MCLLDDYEKAYNPNWEPGYSSDPRPTSTEPEFKSDCEYSEDLDTELNFN